MTINKLPISIVIPVFNVEKYIDRCILSLINQSTLDFEMVFVDDCGKDASMDVVRRYAQEHGQIKIVECHRNLGTYHARRIGVLNCTGKYVLFLDPDDELEINTLQSLSLKMASDSDIVFFESMVITTNGRSRRSGAVPRVTECLARDRFMTRVFSESKLSLGVEGKLFKKELLLKAYDRIDFPVDKKLVYSEDALLFAAFLMDARVGANSHRGRYVYHKNSSSITEGDDFRDVNVRLLGLKTTMSYIEKFTIQSDIERMVKRKILNKLEVNFIKQSIKIDQGFFSISRSYLRVFSKTRRLNDFMKLIIFVLLRKKF